MKVVFSLLLSLGLITGAFAQEQVLPAAKIMDDAYALASKENKKVFVIFHASWCSWCKRMDSIMNMPELKPLFDKNFVIKHLVVQEVPNKKNLENPGAQEFMVKHNGDKQGIPFWLIFNAKGKLLGDSRMPATDKKTGKKIKANTGCPADPGEVDYFVKLLKKTTSLTDTELAIIAKKFAR
ncbi:MAG: thioredoxin family protein [Bacteroidia bacterium]|nr:thioredoxin family protein [Bacteroidia bacterium]